MSFLDNLEWRYAAKIFSEKEVTEAQLQKIKESIRFSPSSKNLQPYHVVIIPRGTQRQQLAEASTNHSQITTASYLLVFCTRTDLEIRAEALIETTALVQNTLKEKLQSYYQSILEVIKEITNKRRSWSVRYMFIAFGFALAACAEMQIDSCPMEGFEKEKWKEILALPEYFHPEALLAIGFRADEPRTKVRFPESDLFSQVEPI